MASIEFVPPATPEVRITLSLDEAKALKALVGITGGYGLLTSLYDALCDAGHGIGDVYFKDYFEPFDGQLREKSI